MFAIPWLLRGLPYLIGVFVVTAALTLAHHYGVRTTTERLDAKYGAEIAQLHAASDKQHAADLEAARSSERDHVLTISAIEATHQKERQDEKAKYDHMLADLRSGALRLRSRFACPAASPRGVPDPAAGAGDSPPTSESGLQSADVLLLVQLADDADQVALQLKAAQAVIAADRAP
jgi:hypothetical protein